MEKGKENGVMDGRDNESGKDKLMGGNNVVTSGNVEPAPASGLDFFVEGVDELVVKERAFLPEGLNLLDGDRWGGRSGSRMAVVEAFDGLHSQDGGETAIAELEARCAVLVDPTDLEAAIVALHRQQTTHIDFVFDPDKVADVDPHSQCYGIAIGTNTFLSALLEQRHQQGVEVGVVDGFEKAGKTEEETFRRGVIAGALQVGSVEKNFIHPVEGPREVLSAPIGVEERESVDANDWIKARSIMIKVRLENAIVVDILQHLVHQAVGSDQITLEYS